MLSRQEEKFIRSLKQKKVRNSEGLFLVEGYKNVCELLDSEYEVVRLLATEEYAGSFGRLEPEVVSAVLVASLSSLTSNESCIAVAKMRTFSHANVKTGDLIVALDGVSDPGNIGTIIRALDWYGFDQMVCSSDCADFYNTKTIAASMGSFTRVIPTYLDLGQFLASVSCPVYGMELAGQALSEFVVPNEGVFVLGSESHGIRPKIASLLDHHLTIPRVGKAESLNVAMATTVLLNHLRFGPT